MNVSLYWSHAHPALHRFPAYSFRLRDLSSGSKGQAYLLVYDIALRALDAFVETITCAGNDSVCVLIRNKAHRTHERAVARAEGARLKQALGCGFVG